MIGAAAESRFALRAGEDGSCNKVASTPSSTELRRRFARPPGELPGVAVPILLRLARLSLLSELLRLASLPDRAPSFAPIAATVHKAASERQRVLIKAVAPLYVTEQGSNS